MDSLNKIYLAGPDVFRPNSLNYFNTITDNLKLHGYVGYHPIDESLNSSYLIYQNNICLIRSCNWILANLDPFRGVSADLGTSFEIGYAAANGLRIVGYYTNGIPKEYKERVGRRHRRSKYSQIEDFGLTDNLMVINACEYVANSIYDAIHYIYTSPKNEDTDE